MQICDTFVNDFEIARTIETLEYQQTQLDRLASEIEALHAGMLLARETAFRAAGNAAMAAVVASDQYQAHEAQLNDLRSAHERFRSEQQRQRAFLDRVTPNILKKWFKI